MESILLAQKEQNLRLGAYFPPPHRLAGRDPLNGVRDNDLVSTTELISPIKVYCVNGRSTESGSVASTSSIFSSEANVPG